ncbi:MAG TPA: formate dehydrogenase accessory sulfurtransferase FdhD [Gemmatimonadales bacterium]|nr:formate dehydrogenase accessory sulfurtransferase FdhD [Gemmatimonadales bacterium]
MTPVSPDLSQMKDPLGLNRLGTAEPLRDQAAVRWQGGRAESRVERIVEEVPVAIAYNRQAHVVMMATPADLEDFALGFTLTEELIQRADQFRGVDVIRYSRGIELQVAVAPEQDAIIAERNRKLTGRTGCGICGADSVDAVLRPVRRVQPGQPIHVGAIQEALSGLTPGQVINIESGAVHAAAWATAEGHVELVREDVGRHNALDKLVGAVVKRGIDPATGFVLVTSRASFEMVQKATVLGVPLLAAISGPTGLAVRVANEAGLTLVGFARGDRLTVYTHPGRVTA